MISRVTKRLAEQKRGRNRRIAALVITCLFLGVLIVAGAVSYWVADSSGYIDKAKQAVGLSPKKINILVLGIDERRNDIGRSNVTCVVTIDTAAKDVSMLWIPRDSRVKIPGHGWNKIGHAYAYDGPKLSKKTVEDLLGIPIDYYVAVNMAGFSKVIDAAGGVDINVEKRMYYYDPYDEGEVADNNGLIDLKPGMQHMNGNTALQFVRFRHDEMGDIGRIERQQKFAKALLAQLANPAVITKIPGIVGEAYAAVKTDLPLSQLLSLGKIVNDAYKHGLTTNTVPGTPVYIDNISYWLPDIVKMRKQVAELQGISLDDNYLEAAQRLAIEYKNAIPKETKVAEGAAAKATDEKPAAAGNPLNPGEKPKVKVINSSGHGALGAKVASIMSSHGFTVTEVDSGPVRKTTTVIVPATDNGIKVKLDSLPFKYVLQVNNNSAKETPLTVIIGQDYVV